MGMRDTLNLDTVSDADLQAELERRKLLKKLIPQRVTNPDFSNLVDCIEAGVADMVVKKYLDEDFKQFVYEAAMTAVYGNNYFVWQNQLPWNR